MAAGEAADASRRRFFKQAGATVAAVAFVGIGAPGVFKGSAFPSLAEAKGMITVDPSLCIGCLTCEVSCSDVHREAGLSDLPRIRIYNVANVTVNPDVVKAFGDRGHFQQQVCLQCPDAPCLPVCPVEALHVDAKTGAREINRDTCIDCGKCEASCLFPSLDEALATGGQVLHQKSRISHDEKLDVFTKCDLCSFRPEGPACIERCPVNIKINQKQISAPNLCLDLSQTVTKENFARLRGKQTATANRQEMQG